MHGARGGAETEAHVARRTGGGMSRDDEDGYVLVKPLFGALPKFENSEPSMKLFFPDLVRAIDMGAEAKRLVAVKFAPAETAKLEDETASEEVARRRSAAPTTVPNDAKSLRR